MSHATAQKHPTARNGAGEASGRLGRASHPLVVLFAVYVILLAWIILWKLEVPFIGAVGTGHIKLVPFVASGPDTASEPLEVAANLLFFLPFGMYLGLLRPSWSRWKHAGAIAAASLLLEVSQYVLAVGSSDVTDVIANTAGGAVGVLAIGFLRRGRKVNTTVVTRVCLVGTTLAVVACLVFFASPLHFGPRDVPLTHSVR